MVQFTVSISMKLFRKIIAILFFSSPLLAYAQGEEYIEWTANSRLNWDDYLAEPPPKSDAAAITNTAIGMEYHIRNNALSFTITCRFSKTKSWGRQKTAYILRHEQGHFDITEIFARKLAKELQEYKFNPHNYEKELNKIYRTVMDEEEEYQNKYDQETDFSRNQEKQQEWFDKIKRDLDDTQELANAQSSARI